VTPGTESTMKQMMNQELKLTNDNEDVVFVVEPSKRKMVRKAKVALEGRLNLYNAAFISEKIGELVGQYDILDFKLQGITEIDLSALQTMHYYKTVFGPQQKSISFQSADLPAEVSTIINKCKYNRVLFRKPTTMQK